MIISCWNRLYRGTLLRLVFSRLCPLSGVGDLVALVDHLSGNVAHVAVLAGKLWFLGTSRSNPLCMGEWVGCRFCLARLNVQFRELASVCMAHGVAIAGKLVLGKSRSSMVIFHHRDFGAGNLMLVVRGGQSATLVSMP